ncbi:hypothetical protein C8J56DRAFT_1172708 [Mycena floridula]|nr:hypothetical protein C8J56DRAFT_1172708 [Mycena floridula]
MDLPELYHYRRKGYWFRINQFFLFLFDGLYQSLVIFFIILFTYDTTSARADGYDVRQSEFSSVMAVIAVMVADLFTGMTATAWTWWMGGLVTVGIVLVWGFTIIYALIAPGYASTFLYGNDYFLFTSAPFWLALPLTITLALAPRYIAKAYRFGFTSKFLAPSDIDIVRWIRKNEPWRDLATFEPGIALADMRSRPSSRYSEERRRSTSGRRSTSRRRSTSSRRAESRAESRRASTYSRAEAESGRSSRAASITTLDPPIRPSIDIRSASRTDMSTGLVSTERGFDFATEEGGGAVIRRMQTDLSERNLAVINEALGKTKTNEAAGKRNEANEALGKSKRGFSLRKSLRNPLKRGES